MTALYVGPAARPRRVSRRAARLLAAVATVILASSSTITLASTASADPAASDWAKLRACESSGNYSIDTGNGYYGAYQFGLGTWESVGGTGKPSDAKPAEQDYRAHILYRMRGWQPWPSCKNSQGLVDDADARSGVMPPKPASFDVPYNFGGGSTPPAPPTTSKPAPPPPTTEPPPEPPPAPATTAAVTTSAAPSTAPSTPAAPPSPPGSQAPASTEQIATGPVAPPAAVSTTEAPSTSEYVVALPIVNEPLDPEAGDPDADAWAALRQCESSDRYDLDTGNGYYGAYQISEETWFDIGGDGLPSEASATEQDNRALLLYRIHGWDAWLCGQALGGDDVIPTAGLSSALHFLSSHRSPAPSPQSEPIDIPAWPGQSYRPGDADQTLALWQDRAAQRFADVSATGQFGPATEAAVLAVRDELGLDGTAVLGPREWEAVWNTGGEPSTARAALPAAP